MLVLSRKVDEGILIGPDIRVTVVNVRGGRVTLAIEAPREIPVCRGEIALNTTADQNDSDAQLASVSLLPGPACFVSAGDPMVCC